MFQRLNDDSIRIIMRAYKTTATQVLNVLTGIPPPLHLTARAEFQKFQACACRSVELGRTLDINNLDYYIKLTDVPIELRTLDITSKVLNNQYGVYTDGSRIGNDTGFSVCILKNGERFKIFQFKLNKNNTVFQTELAAVDFAVCWALKNGIRINIHTDVNLPLRLC
ncbi:hypothetical protein AVEN_234210-1 [Araneus ventricosus]|uniref:RNase H type-1 domain-containing protein n=1 Tax=Araneus ventricosus TaxID=182803 RepID=A0A4Y2A7P5_ARAVE|nr:hypothetical protein AVEN_234210-1 [Araneus ventricosus]